MNYDDLVRRLRDYIGAYPEDLFPPLTMEEKQETTKLPGLFARGCAQMGRRFEKEAAEAADAIQELQRERDALMRGEFICKRCGIRKDAEFDLGDF